MAETYTPSTAVLQGSLPATLTSPQGLSWDGQQLVVTDTTDAEIWTLARNADESYTPGNAVLQGDLAADLTFPSGVSWDGQQLVIAHLGGSVDPREIWTLARNADGSYTPGNAVKQGDLPTGLATAANLAWDGQQLVIADSTADNIWTLARNADGSYTPGNAVEQGDLPSGLTEPRGLAWDGQQLVIVENQPLQLGQVAQLGRYWPGQLVIAEV